MEMQNNNLTKVKALNDDSLYNADRAIADTKASTTLPVGIVWYWLCIDDVMTLCKHAIRFDDSDDYHELYRIECDERFKFFVTSPDGIEFGYKLDLMHKKNKNANIVDNSD